jgi:septal ring factor EnvC (AmiA/AmiB activator)
LEDIVLIIGALSLFITFVGAIIALFKHFDNRMDKIQDKVSENQKAISQEGEKLNSTEKTLNRFEVALEKFQEQFREVSIEVYQMVGSSKKSTGNPISAEEKENLIKKMKKGTIDEDEAKKLKRVLEEEKRVAEDTGDTVATIAIGLLLAALAYLLYKLISEER